MFRRYWVHGLTLLVGAALFLAREQTALWLQAFTTQFLDLFGWLVLGASTGALILCAVFAFSRFGRERLGGADAKPEFSSHAWVMMLFAAGMGAGLVFWGAAEPLIHTLNPPPGVDAAPGSAEAAREAMALTMLHWALHPWAIYAIGAIAIGYFGFSNGKTTLRPSAALGLTGPARRWVDQIAVFAVLFGIVASLGQGVIQITAGFGATVGADGARADWIGVAVMGTLFVVYMASAATGLQRGIKWLSEINIGLTGLLLVFIAAVGPTVFALNTLLSTLGDYLARLPDLSFELRPAFGDEAMRSWTRGWTLLYFMWWVAWIPFVGVFVARISYGRTIREIVFAVVFAPSALTLAWFGILGGSALHAQFVQGVDLGVADFTTAPRATYALLAQYSWAGLTQAVTAVLVFIFLVTSADSGSYVLAMLSEHRDQDPPVSERLFWGTAMAALTVGALLTGEGQSMMRALAVAGGAPMLLLMIAMGVKLIMAAARAGAGGRNGVAGPAE